MLRSSLFQRCLPVAVFVLGMCLSYCRALPAQEPARSEETNRPIPQTYKSKSFLLITDLSEEEAKELLGRLETMLGYVSRYWGRPHRGVIKMYVAESINEWPRKVLAEMAPEGIVSIQSGGGLTIGTIAVRGNEFRSKAVVYAVANHGTPQHEAVHAYCDHAFGGTGPVWYSEGMAEVGNYWRDGEKGVSAPSYVINYLKESRKKPLNAIVNNPLERTGDSWQNYAWRWALCHLLGHNKNYTRRFKPLGLQLLSRKEIDFWQVYGSQAEEIDFEYQLFLKNMAPGYRVDLCSWDWKTRFTAPAGGRSMVAKIDAAAGWQPSRVLLTAGTEYEYAASGTWHIGSDDEEVSADGLPDMQGRMVGIILKDYELGEEFELGSYGRLTPEESGKLYLRCRDNWGEIADNDGTVTFRMKQAGTGRPLPNPNASDDESSSAE